VARHSRLPRLERLQVTQAWRIETVSADAVGLNLMIELPDIQAARTVEVPGGVAPADRRFRNQGFYLHLNWVRDLQVELAADSGEVGPGAVIWQRIVQAYGAGAFLECPRGFEPACQELTYEVSAF
jgi:hypothetical protein